MNPDPQTSPDWRQRREAAVEACHRCAYSRHDEKSFDKKAFAEIKAFASDPKWEVRKVVAEAIASLPPKRAREISNLMASENNAMVEAAIRRSISRRQLGGDSQPGHEGLLQDEFEKIRTKYGQDAADAARELAEKSTAVHIRAAVHDIRNIITYLRPSNELISDPTHKRNVSRIIRGRDYLRRMLDMMDKYTAPLSVVKSTESILGVVEDSVATARDQIRNEGFDPRLVGVLVFIPDAVTFSVARLEIVIALSNLIKNAIESHGRKDEKILAGKVKITGDVHNEFIRIRIRDVGHGLSQSDLDGLLNYAPGKTSKQGGSGYGLPLCNRYICAHGGRLEFESKEDRGTIATVLLPLS